MLYLIEILHQTTTWSAAFEFLLCCILLKFYIKPQLHREYNHELCVVSYWNSTSNHNLRDSGWWSRVLYLIEILHQTTTSARVLVLLWRVVSYWNSTSNHNRKAFQELPLHVVSYWNSTSNHNQLYSAWMLGQVVSYWNSTSNHNSAWLPSSSKQVVSYWNSTSNHNVGPHIDW